MGSQERIDRLAGDHAPCRSERLPGHRRRRSPDSARALRKFTSDEAAQRLGVKDAPRRKLSLDGNGPAPAAGATTRRPTSVQCGASGTEAGPERLPRRGH
jgi:hypothetical protein